MTHQEVTGVNRIFGLAVLLGLFGHLAGQRYTPFLTYSFKNHAATLRGNGFSYITKWSDCSEFLTYVSQSNYDITRVRVRVIVRFLVPSYYDISQITNSGTPTAELLS